MRSQTEILADVTELAVEYYKACGKPLGVTGEIAEVAAAKALDLQLAEARQTGFDAYRQTGRKKETIQIKGRWKRNGGNWGRVPSINTDHQFDIAMLVLLHEDYDLLGIWEAPFDTVREALDKPGSKSRNVRRSMSVSQFKSISKRVWPQTD